MANCACVCVGGVHPLLVLLRLEGSADFVKVPLTAADISSNLEQQLSSIDPVLANVIDGDLLPILRIAYKSHKQNYMNLTNASGTLLSPLNSLAQSITSCLMQAVTSELAVFNGRVQRWHGAETQSCIVVLNSLQVILNLPDRILSDLCADITSCFENIPINIEDAHSLLEAMQWAIDLAFGNTERSMPASATPVLVLSKATGALQSAVASAQEYRWLCQQGLP